ncbi:TonB-dependent receptor [Sphingobium sp. V4]|uniref:TonB-dependent receptor n=1 Tax=Sphingobium sp. V4 TaxID=3038927 RepID=UPI00255830C3|nr:TonB-dependent receptor [Sphingobium sp. V4]WIW89468.1 TonB-dependent receptor [Sphingobium sp. V4]
MKFRSVRRALAIGASIAALAVNGSAWAQSQTVPQDTQQPISGASVTAAPTTEQYQGGQDRGSPVTGSTGGLEDIIVTARRSSESLLKVPVAVTALSSDALVRNNVTTLESAAQLVPFVTLARFAAGNGALLSIRGIGSTPTDAGVQQSVLVNFDNVLVGRGRLIQQGLYDLAQMEVLKGPQALFYGKNSPAGVISITTADPGNKLEGYARAGYEFVADERYFEGAIGGPVTDTLKVRLAGRYAAMDGYIHNSAPAQPFPNTPAFAPWIAAGATLPGASARLGPNTEDIGARLTVVWDATPSLNIKLKYSYGRARNAGDDELYILYCGRGITHPSAYGSLDLNGDCAFDRHTSVSDFPAVLTANMPEANGGVPYGRLTTHIASLNANWEINDQLKLAAITGFYDLRNTSSFVANQTSFAGIYNVAEEHTWSIAQELRLSSDFDAPVNFVIGGYIDRIHQWNNNHSAIAPLPVDPATGKYYTYDRLIDFVSTSQSVFGQIIWDITPSLELTAGARYTRDKRDSLDGLTYVNPAFAANLRAQGNYLDRIYRGSNYSPEATLSWRPDARQTLYIAYKTGYKSGGFSYPAILIPSFTDENTTFKPETAKGFELGYKAQLLDNRLRLEIAAYRTNYKNQQLSSFDATLNSFIVSNAGRTRVQGIEMQVAYVPIEGLNLRGALGYNDAKYQSYVGAACIAGSPAGCLADLSGRRLPRAPKWSGNFGATYDMSLGNDLKLGFNGDAFYSSSYNTLDSLDPETVQASFWKLNAGISIGAEDDTWKLSFIGRNLTNEFINLFGNDSSRGSPGDYIGVPARPREFVIEGTYRF